QFADFAVTDYREAMKKARKGDLIYCDPPYKHSQSILYGGQQFRLEDLFEEILRCKSKGVYVALSIDGTKKSGKMICDIPTPDDLFGEEIFVNVGRSMLRRFQMEGQTLESEVVSDRLLLTYTL
ncbi:MAG: DNA adenine methylase, partial [Nitrospirota bacterium]